LRVVINGLNCASSRVLALRLGLRVELDRRGRFQIHLMIS
jgi:hypothetical protein